jgi:hypothetical protein
MLYTAKCFWPGATEDVIRLAAARLGTAFRGALYLPADEIVLCVVDSTSPASVKRASEEAGIPCERVIETVCVVGAEARREE